MFTKSLINLQCLLKFGLIEDNVTVFQWPWNSESGQLVNCGAEKIWKKKNYEFLRKCFFREKDS